MVSSNTESGITVAYDDSDNTLDFTVGTLNQDTTGTAALATSVTISANNSTDETIFPVFVDGATGTQGLETDTGFTYNPSTGLLTATGLAGTLSTAAQTNITSLGTLSSLAITGDLTVDTNVLKVDTTNNRIGVKTASPSVAIDAGTATDAILLPKGTTAQRPSGAAGQFRYNTTLSKFEGYTDAWGEIGGGGTSTFSVNTYTANGSTTAFTLSKAPDSEDNIIVFVEGVFMNPNDFTLNGTTLTLDAAPPNGRKIVVYHVSAAVAGTGVHQNSFTGDGSTTAFTLGVTADSENNTQVYIDGVYQNKATYAVSGTTLTFDAAPANSAAIEVMTLTQTNINTFPASGISGLTEVTPVAGDHVMIHDATDNALKKSDVKDLMASAVSITSSADAVAMTFDSNENATFAANVEVTGDITGQDDLFLDSDAAVIHLGEDGDVTLTHVADTGVLINSSRQLQFGDSGTYIHQSADGVLDLVADTEIEINATTIDINGAINASGEIVAASLDISGDIDVDGTTNLDVVDIDGAVDMASTLLVGGTVLSTAAALVNSTSAGGFGFASNNTAFYSFGEDASTAGSYTFQNLSNNASVNITAMKIAADGKVGIGTTSPSSELHLYKSNGNPTLNFENSATATDSGDFLGKIEFKGNDGSSNASGIRAHIHAGIQNSSGGAFLAYGVANSSSTVAEAMRIQADGKVGIGDTSPSAQLHINTGTATGSGGSADYSSGTNMSLYIENSGSSGYPRIFHKSASSSVASVTNCESGKDMYWGEPTDTGTYYFRGRNLSIGATKKLYVDDGGDTYISEYSANEFEIVTGNTRKFALSGGNLFHTGSINSNHSFSDERLKENIVEIPNALEKVTSLRGITFTRKDDGSVGTGLIAQELEKVLPEAVYKSKTIDSLEDNDAEEWKAINYGNTVGLLVEAIKEQQVLIETLQKEVEELKGG